MNPVAVSTALDAAVPRLRPHFRLQWEEVQNAWVLLYPEGMVKLSPSAGEILRRCDGATPLPAIVDDLEKAFSTGGLAADVSEFCTLAEQQGWLEVRPEVDR